MNGHDARSPFGSLGDAMFVVGDGEGAISHWNHGEREVSVSMYAQHIQKISRCIRTYVCMYVCTHSTHEQGTVKACVIQLYLCTHTVRTYTQYTLTYVCTYIRTYYTQTHVRTNVRMHVYVHIHVCTYVCTYKYIDPYYHTHMYVYTYIRIYMRIHV